MERYFSFARSCVGASHLRRGIECQDNSLCADRKSYAFAAVADGHGSQCYLRTERGSRFAVECALECAAEFMESLEDAAVIMEQPREREALLNQLWRSIISRWHQRVEDDHKAQPFTEDELESIPEKYANYRGLYEKGRYIMAYGTTLLFAVMTGEFGFCIQIGDGSCCVLNGDGSIAFPVPEDPHCHDNVTTSMCQDDAALCARSCYFSGNDLPAAVFLGTDGVGNSYGNEDDLGGFYRGLALTIAENGTEEGVRQLEEFLPVMTKKGSGDDVSCSGIADISALIGCMDKLNSTDIAEEEPQD